MNTIKVQCIKLKYNVLLQEYLIKVIVKQNHIIQFQSRQHKIKM